MGTPRLLLDANLSPKVGRNLSTHLQLDVLSRQGLRLGQLPDNDVIRMARSMRRVIVTMDRDFADVYHRVPRSEIGIVYLDLPNTLRTVPEISRLLIEFFESLGDNDNLEHSLVVITGDHVRIIHR